MTRIMSQNTITVAYEGKVNLKELELLVSNCSKLVHSLSTDIAGESGIQWEVTDLQPGSATLTFTGEHAPPEKVHAVVNAWEVIGYSVEKGEQVPYPDKIKKCIDGITRQLNGRVLAARFETEHSSFKVRGEDVVFQLPKPGLRTALGTVKGKVQKLSTRTKPQIVLYDHLFDNAVTCHLDEDRKKEMLGYLDKIVTVFGKVSRDTQTGRAKSIRDIKDIKRLREVAPGDYEKARGVLAWMGDEPAEKLIRQLRDG
ncbi:MAG: hypothetical protein OXB89_05595 [Anaerolineaceae bacterium]|nr:hypothetical protein [Anaerolineaceae bacterium]